MDRSFKNFTFKVYNTLGLCLVFVGVFRPFSLMVLKWNIQLRWKITFIHCTDYLCTLECNTSKIEYIFFILKYFTQLWITSTWQKAAASGGWRWLYLLKNTLIQVSANDWSHKNGKKAQHFSYYTLWYLFFVSWNILF